MNKKINADASLTEIKALLETIPENKWCRGIRDNGKGQFCALGHINRRIIGNSSDPWESPIESELCALVVDHVNLANANNQDTFIAKEKYPQATPKLRTLAFFDDLVANEAGV